MGSYSEAVHLTGFYSLGRTMRGKAPYQYATRLFAVSCLPHGSNRGNLGQIPPAISLARHLRAKLPATKSLQGYRRPQCGRSYHPSIPRTQVPRLWLAFSSLRERLQDDPTALDLWSPLWLRYDSCGFLLHRPLITAPIARQVNFMTSATIKPVIVNLVSSNHPRKGELHEPDNFPLGKRTVSSTTPPVQKQVRVLRLLFLPALKSFQPNTRIRP